MAVLAQLGKYQLIIHTDLELTPLPRQQGNGFDLRLKFFQQLGR
jgi:hypothetical protein